MRKLSGLLVFLFVIGLVFSGSSLVMAGEHGGESMPAAEAAMTMSDEEMATVKDAWAWAKDANPDLAAKLEMIVNGDMTNAPATMAEAATATKDANPDMSAKLQAMADKMSKEHGGKEHAGT